MSVKSLLSAPLNGLFPLKSDGIRKTVENSVRSLSSSPKEVSLVLCAHGRDLFWSQSVCSVSRARSQAGGAFLSRCLRCRRKYMLAEDLRHHLS